MARPTLRSLRKEALTMSAKNVKTLRAAHESWNKRDFAGVVSNAVKGLAYTDHGRNITLNTRDKFREWTEGWAKAFSDGRITNPQYIDAGDIVVAQFTAEGTNDGPLGSLKPTGHKMSLAFCEICHFDKEGRMVSGGCYYDQYTLLTQLGHIQPLAMAA
jgi:predicted ester cyclase